MYLETSRKVLKNGREKKTVHYTCLYIHPIDMDEIQKGIDVLPGVL